MKTIFTILAFFNFSLAVSAQTVGKSSITAPGTFTNGGGGGLIFTTSGALTINCVTIYPYSHVNGTQGDLLIGVYNATIDDSNHVTIGSRVAGGVGFNVTGYTQSPLTPEVISPHWFIPAAGTYYIHLDGWGSGVLGMMYDSMPCTNCSYPYTGSGVSIIGYVITTQLHTDMYFYYYNWSIGANCITAVDEITEDNFSIFPNPTTNLLTITTTSTKPSQIILYDIASRQLMQQKFIGSATLNIEGLAKGVYLYQVKDEKGIKQGKVVKE